MNIVDATDRGEKQDEAEPPSLLTIILDTNPNAWALLADSLPLSKAVANLLVFVNAHLAINHANRVAILASHAERAEWLYPTPPRPHAPSDTIANGTTDPDRDESSTRAGGPVQPPPDDANKYRPFAAIEHAVQQNLRRLLATTTPSNLTSTPATLLAGALTLALTYIAKQTASLPSSTPRTQFNYSDPTSVSAGTSALGNPTSTTTADSHTLSSRILLLSVSGDLTPQYIPLMNAIFAAQRRDIPIDIAKLAGDAVFLQQAADATGGVYIPLTTPLARAGLLQYLMFAFLPDAAARRHLIPPGEGGGDGVDFRAACFCHRRVVDVGWVCSVCLSIFCAPLADRTCLTCGSALRVAEVGRKPVVVARRKKKKKRAGEGGGVETPGSAGGTPGP